MNYVPSRRTAMPKTYSFKEKQRLSAQRQVKLVEKATPSELRMKDRLDRMGLKYRFQRPILMGDGFAFVDFYIGKGYMICLELDGGYHTDPKIIQKDKRRDEFLRNRGFRVLHMTNEAADTIGDVELRKLLDETKAIPRGKNIYRGMAHAEIEAEKTIRGQTAPARIF